MEDKFGWLGDSSCERFPLHVSTGNKIYFLASLYCLYMNALLEHMNVKLKLNIHKLFSYFLCHLSISTPSIFIFLITS